MRRRDSSRRNHSDEDHPTLGYQDRFCSLSSPSTCRMRGQVSFLFLYTTVGRLWTGNSSNVQHHRRSLLYRPCEHTINHVWVIHERGFPSTNPFPLMILEVVLRRRPSNRAHLRRRSGGEYDGARPSFSQDGGFRRPLRSRDDRYYREEKREFSRRDEYHPYSKERSRTPGTYRNVDAYERAPGSASKPYFDKSRMNRDIETGGGWRQDRKRISDEESIDGYNYEGHKNSRTARNFKSFGLEEKAEVKRLLWMQWMNSDVKNRKSPYPSTSDSLLTFSAVFVATIGEFVGTTMFLFSAFAGTQVANIQSRAATDSNSTSNTTSGGATGFNVSVYLYIFVIFGFSLMVNVWIFFRISGGMFNPAVTFGMVMHRWSRACCPRYLFVRYSDCWWHCRFSNGAWSILNQAEC